MSKLAHLDRLVKPAMHARVGDVGWRCRHVIRLAEVELILKNVKISSP